MISSTDFTGLSPYNFLILLYGFATCPAIIPPIILSFNVFGLRGSPIISFCKVTLTVGIPKTSASTAPIWLWLTIIKSFSLQTSYISLLEFCIILKTKFIVFSMLSAGLEFFPRMIAASFSISMSGPIGSNTIPDSSIRFFQHGWEPSVTSNPFLFSSFDRYMYGCTSPRVPIVNIAIFCISSTPINH